MDESYHQHSGDSVYKMQKSRTARSRRPLTNLPPRRWIYWFKLHRVI